MSNTSYKIVGKITVGKKIVGYKVESLDSESLSANLDKETVFRMAYKGRLANASYNKYTNSLVGIQCDLRTLPSKNFSNIKDANLKSQIKYSALAERAKQFIHKQRLLGVEVFKLQITEDCISILEVLDKESTGRFVIPSFITEVGHMAFIGCSFTEIYIDNLPNVPFNATALCKRMDSESIKVVFRHPESVVSISNMFEDCQNLKSIDLSTLSKVKVNSLNNMFANCYLLESVDLSVLDFSNVESMNYMFLHCNSLKNIVFPKLTTSKIQRMENTFKDCRSLTEISLENFSMVEVRSIDSMFSDCSNLEKVTLSKYNTDKLEIANYLFNYCVSLKTISFKGFTTPRVTHMEFMFSDCRSLTSLDLTSFDTRNLEYMSYMFLECRNLQKLDISSFKFDSLKVLDFSRIPSLRSESLDNIFLGCTSLQEIHLPDSDTLDRILKLDTYLSERLKTMVQKGVRLK